ncbi:LPXTG cell wall anchor domain-containing protein [Pseudogracilibacillus auburnensis]|uniref:LPXTG-motif cell wall-anchored protein n=1 Tax=Pseudogracilibacillus auburnensis TaxID=1494959 RepID=A0A2V3VUV4_9BACI|nr:LPXTG cell wall anchor domain-containing protein [Pseudogracilibacillus auburnensis]PXW84844.1 LPXTG-motif cell wall-anchored protein [Pseudogracilibacillus auburnensis]
MNLPIPDFVPVFSPDTILTISIVLLIIGVCLVGVGLLMLFLYKRKNKKVIVPWICTGAGLLLAINHGIQLLFRL